MHTINDKRNEKTKRESFEQNIIIITIIKSRLKGMYASAATDAEREEDVIRKALSKIYEIRSIRNERRIMAKQAGSKETIRRGALMKVPQLSFSDTNLLLEYIYKYGD